ncbi:LacI family DNA-binding transcriptional regulator [Microbacterium sp. A93]|uniref:LacI family DNA-binding transcriptional regulator n=1 Tax=unclassified Microbacterium TaxID=2609290 RepID=UPI003F43C869
MSASLNDVAKLAGVSPRTVSNVVNDFVHVRDTTRQRVLAAIEEVGYRPNISARRLRQGRTRILGFAVPELSQPYFAELSELVEIAAQKRGYTVIAAQTGGIRENEVRVLRDLGSHIVDGLVFSPMTMEKEELYLTPPNVPTVLIGEQISSSRYTNIAIDNVSATADITRHLLERGHRRIATLGAYHSDVYRSSRLRLSGYRQALEDAGIPFDPALVLYTDRFGRQAGLEGITQAWKDGTRFDALVCFTDLLAFGAIRAFADLGVRVPEDVAIASIDDVQEAEFSVPSLTTIAPNKQAIADQAVDSLLALLDDDTREPTNIDIGYELIVRESSGRD